MDKRTSALQQAAPTNGTARVPAPAGSQQLALATQGSNQLSLIAERLIESNALIVGQLAQVAQQNGSGITITETITFTAETHHG